MAAEVYNIQFKSDFVLTLTCDAGWETPFCIKFWTNQPGQCYFVGWDGETYTRCRQDENDPKKLIVLFDDHGLGLGELKMQMAWHTTIEDFPNTVLDEVMNKLNVTIDNDGTEKQVVLALEGDSAPEIQYALPAYVAEAQRIENELQRQQNELDREQNEEERISAEESRQQTFETLKGEVESLKDDAQDAVVTANEASRIANAAADNADAKAAEAEAAAGNANDAAEQAVSIANNAATRAVGIATDAAEQAESIANEAARKANAAADNADAKAADAEEAAAGADNVDAAAEGTRITITNRLGESTTVDVSDVMLELIGINGILDEINGEEK